MKSRVLLAALCLVIAGCGDAVGGLSEQAQLHALRLEAERLHDDGQSEQAITRFEKLVASPAASDAQKAYALRYISLGYYELGDYPRSGEYAAKAAAFYPKGSYDYLVNMADAELMLGKVPEAVVRLEQAVAMAPRKLAANNVLGLVYLGDNGEQYVDYRKALVYNQAAYEIEPGRITEIVLARNLLALQEYQQARTHLLDLSQRYADDTYVHNLLAQAQAGLAQAEE
jgi:tetratricopeptide (TPR) repeat protein